jgi:hypothetical protein
MLTNRKRLAAAAVTVVAAGAIAVPGLTAAAAVPAARPAVSGTEAFQLVTTTAASQNESVIATGVFTAGGVDHQGNKVDTIKLPGGTFKIAHGPGKGSQKFNPNTCLTTINERGAYKVEGGTGRYAGISGHGTSQVSVEVIAARSKGVCSATLVPVAYQQIITASGPVHL